MFKMVHQSWKKNRNISLLLYLLKVGIDKYEKLFLILLLNGNHSQWQFNILKMQEIFQHCYKQFMLCLWMFYNPTRLSQNGRLFIEVHHEEVQRDWLKKFVLRTLLDVLCTILRKLNLIRELSCSCIIFCQWCSMVDETFAYNIHYKNLNSFPKMNKRQSLLL